MLIQQTPCTCVNSGAGGCKSRLAQSAIRRGVQYFLKLLGDTCMAEIDVDGQPKKKCI